MFCCNHRFLSLKYRGTDETRSKILINCGAGESEVMAENNNRSSSSGDEASEDQSWVEWFCKQDGNEFFCEVDTRYIGMLY